MFAISMKETKQFRDGVWFDEGGDRYLGDPDKSEHPIFLIARDQNKSYIAALESERKKHKAKLRKDNLSMEDNLEIASRAIGKAILMDWRNVVDEVNKEPIESTVANRILAMRINPEFKATITACSADFKAFGEAERDKQAGKSQPGSSGSPSTIPKASSG